MYIRYHKKFIPRELFFTCHRPQWIDTLEGNIIKSTTTKMRLAFYMTIIPNTQIKTRKIFTWHSKMNCDKVVMPFWLENNKYNCSVLARCPLLPIAAQCHPVPPCVVPCRPMPTISAMCHSMPPCATQCHPVLPPCHPVLPHATLCWPIQPLPPITALLHPIQLL